MAFGGRWFWGGGTTWVWVLAATFGCTRLAGLAPSRSLVGVSGIFVEFVLLPRGKLGEGCAASAGSDCTTIFPCIWRRHSVGIVQQVSLAAATSRTTTISAPKNPLSQVQLVATSKPKGKVNINFI